MLTYACNFGSLLSFSLYSFATFKVGAKTHRTARRISSAEKHLKIIWAWPVAAAQLQATHTHTAAR